MINKKMVGPLTEETTRVILECISDGVFTIDYNWEITSFNRAAEEITGIARKDAIGRHCWEVFRSNMCEHGCALKKTMEEGRPFINTSGYIINSEKKRIPITTSTSLFIDKNGDVIGGVETFRDHSLVEELRKELSSSFMVEDIVSKSTAMKKIFNILPQISGSDSSVLIEGETGTGKELMARAIHNMSPRTKKPFIAINCGAMPDTLLESELFGYKKGAFTNAVKDKPGQFALAHGGTVFLDEIGDTSPAFQVSLLRVLQEHEFTPLGGLSKEKTDVRIIAATNQNLAELLEKNQFRQDLYYRINVIRLTLPPLRQRMEDIPLLVERFINKLNMLQKKFIQDIDTKVIQALMSYGFPGNIRELENIIEHAFVLCSEGYIQLHHLPNFLHLQATISAGKKNDPVKAVQIKLIIDALARNDNNRNSAAKELGIHKSTLFRRIKKLGIKL
ncbi:MAG: sigma 54-interacting transcriptional regulator [Desulfobacula sp.]|jgi:PAS domain S-box-containing protein|uniref:sigma-54 interaction domain-containing protein n=1 Tax=Desulfobacula sp. TaxID=2593537 RepID=UPI001D70611C|nr:sigma 54-interacting transcriptional regulator [Desulfobacula sp.]MBT3484055.1 sigma 54-interacting transcriptional regulator [Desulfobacula sp.]MBT3805124.1 sigma 54-interacting transcriptional regulator [Desulfobacula sp.]MBT4026042.1 sigma 54-interacting transcriptional regulator [Desulfobacula sp.]MBT4199799.1 sigma 54-interacting transcriptional regulator [Desulfobacula sp.]